MKKIKIICMFSLTALLGSCNIAEEKETAHEHTYATTWSYNSTQHWHNANCDHKDQKKDAELHTMNSLGICEKCGFIQSVKPTMEKIAYNTYTMTLTDDYFEDYLQAGGGATDKVIMDFAKNNISDDSIYDYYDNAFGSHGACSSCVYTLKNGEHVHARNFDFYAPFHEILIHNIPKSGYESLSMTSLACFGIPDTEDPLLHQQALKAAEFVPLDGMNSAGLCLNINDLYDPNTYTRQDNGKVDLTITCLNRLLLNKAATVEEAIELINQYDIFDSDTRDNSYHIMISDKNGDACIVEFYRSELQIIRKQNNNEFFGMTNTEMNSHFPQTTEYNSGWKDCTRYKAMLNKYNEFDGELNYDDGLEVIKSASVSGTVHTILFNKDTLSVDLCRYRGWENRFHYSLLSEKISLD